jgi:hypothetical protein
VSSAWSRILLTSLSLSPTGAHSVMLSMNKGV